jgi:AraC-like DNA-binding protein
MYKTASVIYFFCMAVAESSFSRYLPVNSEATRWEIWCNDAGYTRVPPAAVYPPTPEVHPSTHAATVVSGRVLQEFQVVYITSGRGWFDSELTGQVEVTAGDLFILFPGIRHAYRPIRETGWHEYWVGFSGEHAQRLWNGGLFTPDRAVHRIGLNHEIIADYEQIVGLCRRQTPGFQIRLGALVLQLLAHIHAIETASRTSAGDGTIVEAARAIMQEHVDEGLSMDEIVARVGVGYTRALGIFRQYTGLTPYQYYLQLRMHRARELLRRPGVTVKEVAVQMNFENQYYFSRLFKKKTGLTPTEWQRRCSIADRPAAMANAVATGAGAPRFSRRIDPSTSRSHTPVAQTGWRFQLK